MILHRLRGLLAAAAIAAVPMARAAAPAGAPTTVPEVGIVASPQPLPAPCGTLASRGPTIARRILPAGRDMGPDRARIPGPSERHAVGIADGAREDSSRRDRAAMRELAATRRKPRFLGWEARFAASGRTAPRSLSRFPSAPLPDSVHLLPPWTPDAEVWRGAQEILLDTATCSCPLAADLGVTHADAPDPVNSGGTITYTTVATNNGPYNASEVKVTVSLNTGAVEFASASPASANCVHASGVVTCSLGILAIGQSQTITVQATAATVVSPFNTASTAAASSVYTDSVSANNSATVSTTILPPSPGATPDGDSVPGVPLLVQKTAPAGWVNITWGASCSGVATNYAIFEGTLGTWYSHFSRSCNTGALSLALSPLAGNRYWLVVPLSSSAEGSYGLNSSGLQIPRSSVPCLPTQILGACP